MRLRSVHLHVERLESRDLPSTYYVAPVGNNNNNGSLTAPWLTIQKAADSVHPGDHVIVRSGHYTGFGVSVSGTVSGRITFSGDPGAIIDTPYTISGNYYGVNCSNKSYITIEGFTFTPQAGQPEWYTAIRFGGTPGNWAKDNVAQNNVAQMRVVGVSGTPDKYGIFTSWQDGLLVANNTISGTYNSGIYASNSARNYTIRGNEVFDAGGNGIHNNGDASNGDPGINYNALIENNLIHNVGFGIGGTAISCDGVQDSRIQNNVIYNAHAKGISLYATDAAEGCKRDVVVNNTVLMTAESYVAFRMNEYSDHNTILNNIFLTAAPSRAWVDVEVESTVGTVFDYNATSDVEMVGGSPASDWTSGYGFDVHSFATTAAALFVNPGANDYHLKAGSPAIDRGTGSNAPTTDREGNHRPQGAGYDIGASERPAPAATKAVFATGSGPGAAPVVKVYNAATGALLQTIAAYGASFTGGVRVAMADITKDGVPDIVTAAGPGAGPHVKVFDGSNYALIRSFYAFPAGFGGGVWLAAADVNGDGYADIVTGAGAGGGPQVKVFSGANNSVLYSFYAYSTAFTGGVQVAAGDVNGDWNAEIITGAGAGGGPHVQVYDGSSGQVIHSFFAYGAGFAGGVFVTAGDVNGDGKADIITGAGGGGGPHVKVFNGADNAVLASFFALDPAGTGGVRVAVADANGDGKAELVVGGGPGGVPRVRVMNPLTSQTYLDFNAYDPGFTGGIFVG